MTIQIIRYTMQQINDEYDTVDNVADNNNLVDCYQIQIDDNEKYQIVCLGKYKDIPVHVNKIINFEDKMLHIITYIMTQEEIQNGIYKIIGVCLFKKGSDESMCALDFIKNQDGPGYQVIFSDHSENTVKIIENIESFPGKDRLVEYVINKAFEEPMKTFISS